MNRKVLSVSFVSGFRAAYFDEDSQGEAEVFYMPVDGFALTIRDERNSNERSLEPFFFDENDFPASLDFNETIAYHSDIFNFLAIVRGDDECPSHVISTWKKTRLPRSHPFSSRMPRGWIRMP
jgi:hypothetical protein